MYVCMYVSHVFDRKLLERLMSPSPKAEVMFASAFSSIGDFFRIFGIHIFQVMASLFTLDSLQRYELSLCVKECIILK